MPPLLTIVLKRFYENRDKIHYAVSVDEHLEFTNALLNETQKFVLTGVVLHDGDCIANGHYTAIVKTKEGYRCFNDDQVINMIY